MNNENDYYNSGAEDQQQEPLGDYNHQSQQQDYYQSNQVPQAQDYYNSDQPAQNYDQVLMSEYSTDQQQYYDPIAPKRKTAGKFILTVVIIIVVLIIAIFGVGLLYFKNDTTLSQSNGSNPAIDSLAAGGSVLPAQNPLRVAAEKKDRPYLGNPEASLVIVEFGDFQCPKCQEEFTLIRQAVLKHSNDVLFIYRNYPVIDNNSPILAKAGLCANDQGKFWQFHDRLYANQNNLASADAVGELARQSGINTQNFSACLTAGKFDTMLQEDNDDAKSLGVIGTPTFFINGSKLEGVVSAADWEKIILKFAELNK